MIEWRYYHRCFNKQYTNPPLLPAGPFIQTHHIRFTQQQSNAFFCRSLRSSTLRVRYIQVHLLNEDVSFFTEEMPQCDTIYHMYSKFQCEPKPRLPMIARPVTIPFTITSIIVYLPRSGGASDNISLSRSVMRMFLIMMLNFLLFPRFCFVVACFCTRNTTRSNHFQSYTLALGPSVSVIGETKNKPYLHVISYQ